MGGKDPALCLSLFPSIRPRVSGGRVRLGPPFPYSFPYGGEGAERKKAMIPTLFAPTLQYHRMHPSLRMAGVGLGGVGEMEGRAEIIKGS